MKETSILIKQKFGDFDEIYGSPKIREELIKDGARLSVKLVSRYMKRLGIKLKIIRKYRATSKSHVPAGKTNISNRDFNTSNTNRKRVTDITYIKTVNNQWSYLCCVMALHSKVIIGYSYMKTMSVD